MNWFLIALCRLVFACEGREDHSPEGQTTDRVDGTTGGSSY